MKKLVTWKAIATAPSAKTRRSSSKEITASFHVKPLFLLMFYHSLTFCPR
jgi:hypothetical protein